MKNKDKTICPEGFIAKENDTKNLILRRLIAARDEVFLFVSGGIYYVEARTITFEAT